MLAHRSCKDQDDPMTDETSKPQDDTSTSAPADDAQQESVQNERAQPESVQTESAPATPSVADEAVARKRGPRTRGWPWYGPEIRIKSAFMKGMP